MLRQSCTRLVRLSPPCRFKALALPYKRWNSTDTFSNTSPGLNPEEVGKLPPIPDNLPRNASAPWLNESQLRLYLPPLIKSGWTLRWNKALCTFYLKGSFPAKRCKRALNLMDTIRTVAVEENHHPDEFGWTSPYVFVNVLTHSATTALFQKSAPDTHPGLTIRDVRFAMLLQDRYRQNFRQLSIPDTTIPVGIERHIAENAGLVKDYMKQAGLTWFEDDV